jgi:pilus assembly protein CpaE
MATNRTPQRFLQAETVLPTMSYRGANTPSAPAASAAPPTTSYRVPSDAAPAKPMAASRPAPPAPPVRVVPRVEIDMEPSVIERMPMPSRVPAPPAPAFVPLAPRRCELTVMFSCRGGSGATTLAVNTAALIARAGRSVCLVDLDLQLGDVCTALDLESQTSLMSVAREAHTLDAVSLRRRLAQHGSGICALSQAGHLDDLDPPQLAARMPSLLDTLRANFDHVVVDGVRDFGDLSLAAIEAATRIVLVVTQDVASVRRAARVLSLLATLGVDEAKCSIVLNRAVHRAAVDDAAIERALAKKIAARIREDARVADSLDNGALLVDVARSRPIVADLAGVAALCRPADPNTSVRRPRRWFKLFGGGS